MCIHDITQTRQRTATKTHNLCTNMHTHTYTHVYTCIRIRIHIHMHICIYTYSCLYIYIHTHIYTHTHDMYICTHACMPGTTAWQRLCEKPDLQLAHLPVRCNPEGSHLPWPAAQLLVLEERRISAEHWQPQLTAAHNTVTTARPPDYTRSSVLVRNQST